MTTLHSGAKIINVFKKTIIHNTDTVNERKEYIFQQTSSESGMV